MNILEIEKDLQKLRDVTYIKYGSHSYYAGVLESLVIGILSNTITDIKEHVLDMIAINTKEEE